MKLWLGSLAALVSAITFALNVTLAKEVYAAGGNIHAINLVRPFAFIAVLLPWLLATGTPMRLPRAKWGLTALLGVLLTAEFYALLGAIIFIPVALAILINYLYPLLIALFQTATGRIRLDWQRGSAIAAAFTGLALALLHSGDVTVSWQGVFLSLLSAVILASILLTGEAAMTGTDRRVVMLYMIFGVTLIIVTLWLSGTVTPRFPQTPSGWWALSISTLCFVAATVLLFVAIDLIGPLATAAIDNSSPVWAILFGALLLGESLTGLQLSGAAMVVGAILVFQMRQSKHAQTAHAA